MKMPQEDVSKKIFVATGILVFDSEIIGERFDYIRYNSRKLMLCCKL
jgi:hypothetical protein